jgi:hypothetical protein
MIFNRKQIEKMLLLGLIFIGFFSLTLPVLADIDYMRGGNYTCLNASSLTWNNTSTTTISWDNESFNYNDSMGVGDGGLRWFGINIRTNATFNLLSVKRYPGVSGNNMSVLRVSNNAFLYSTSNESSDIFYFPINSTLNASTDYRIVLNSGVNRGSGTSYFPYITRHYNVTHGIFSGIADPSTWTNLTNEIFDMIQINSSIEILNITWNNTSTSLNYTNISTFYNQVYFNGSLSEYTYNESCGYGCDVITGRCNPPSYLVYLGIFILFTIIIGMIIKRIL